MTTINTHNLAADDCVSTMPAEACTGIGADQYDGAAPEGAAIVVLAFVASLICIAMLVHVVVSYF